MYRIEEWVGTHKGVKLYITWPELFDSKRSATNHLYSRQRFENICFDRIRIIKVPTY